MARTKRGVITRAKHNKVLKLVKGQEEEEKYYQDCPSGNGKSNAICLQR